MSTRIRAALAGRYVLERELGRGSTATVHAARDLKHGRHVALKVIEPDVASTVGTSRFLQEIRTTAGLNHPHILPLFDSGDAAGFLYYTMPLVEGESLRARLDRAGTFPFSAALPLIRQIADALSYAHSSGVVHRDLKPENILITGQDHVWIADFGLAAALASATSHRLTSTGTAIGSPPYMSPEQASGEERIDPRSDIYSLACIVFEMLCGQPPFTAGSVSALLARHISEPAPSIGDRCPELPSSVDAALRRGMSKDPSHRFRDAVEFTTALEARGAAPDAATGPMKGRARPTSAPRRVWRAAAALVAFVLVTAFLLTQEWSRTVGGWAESWAGAPALDTAVYALFPLAAGTGEEISHHTDLLHDALRQWSGLRVLSASELDLDTAAALAASANPDPALRAARRAGVGRLITGRVVPGADSASVSVRLYDTTRPGSAIREVTGRVPATGGSDSYRRLAEDLLFDGVFSSAAAGATASYPARRLFNSGMHGVVSWQLLHADSQLAAAVDIDPDFAQAWLWLAQARVWMGRSEAEWHYAAEQAHRRSNLLTSSDSIRADALMARAQGRIVDACNSYRLLTRRDTHDFAGWFGLGHCLRSDSVVVRDPLSSPSEWRFRASYREALEAYQVAFRIQPSLHRAFRNKSYRGLQELLHTRRRLLRPGRAERPDTLTFRAYPTWQSDSLAFIPFASNLTTPSWLDSTAIDRALNQQRRLFYDLATTWRVSDRGNPEALEAVAVGLDLLGDPAALDTLRKARLLARSPAERSRIGASEVWLQLKYSIPDDIAGMAAARELADSLLADPLLRDADPGALSGLAALLGKVNLSIRLARHPRVLDAAGLHPGIAAPIVSLFAFSAAGAPADSIRRYQERVDQILGRMDPETRRRVMSTWYSRSAGLALPSYRFRNFERLTPLNPLLGAQIAFVQADTAAVRDRLAAVATIRRARGIAPADVTVDAVVQEAWLLLQVGDAGAALDLLRLSLDALSQMPLDLFMSDGMPSSLVRAMVLRAEAARALGDAADAARWAAAAQLILARREPVLDPLFMQLTSIHRGP